MTSSDHVHCQALPPQLLGQAGHQWPFQGGATPGLCRTLLLVLLCPPQHVPISILSLSPGLPSAGQRCRPRVFFFFFLNFWLCWVFAAVCSGLSLVAVSESCSVVAVGERLISVASLVAEHGLEAAVVAAPGL